MSKVEHTPGTWVVGHAGFERKPVVVAKRAGRPVTVATFDSGKREEDEANAALVAAAPEVFDAAAAVIRQWDTPNWKLNEPTGAIINRLRTALSAATQKQE